MRPRTLRQTSDTELPRPFSLTLVFIVGAAVLIFVAFLFTVQSGKKLGKDMTLRVAEELAESEGKVFASTLGQIVADSFYENPTAPPFDQERVTSLLEEFHHIGLLDAEGHSLWSIGQGERSQDSHRDHTSSHNSFAVQAARNGESTTWLESKHTADVDGHEVWIDLSQSYVPLITGGSGQTTLIFHLSKDVTTILASNIEEASSGFRSIVLTRMAILLGLLSFFVFLLDLQNMRRARRVLNSEREVRNLLSQQNAELQRFNHTKNELITRLAHEFKTPLTAVLGFARILRSNKRGNLNATQLKHAEIINRNGLRLDLLVNELLDLAQVEDGGAEITKKNSDIGQLIHDVVNGFETTVAERGQILRVEVGHDEVSLMIDTTRISQVLSNLVSNASKYSTRDSTITVRSTIDVESWTVTVSDDGPGIPENYQGNLFEMFYRTPAMQESSVPGTGLGLYLSREIVTQHGGEIELSSVPGEGTMVTFTIPLEPAQASVPNGARMDGAA